MSTYTITSTILPKSLIVICLRRREDWGNVENYQYLGFKTGAETVIVTKFADMSRVVYFVGSFPSLSCPCSHTGGVT
jgi:hypothetical protein